MRDRVIDTTVRISFNTNNANGAPVAPSSAFAATDFRIYKDGSASQKTTTNGITVTSPFVVLGDHLIEIDTSNGTDDAGFWVAGSEYRVKINSAKTVDSQDQTGVEVGSFRLVAAEPNTVAPATPANVTDAKTAILATLPTSGRAATQASVDVVDGIVDSIFEDTGTTLPDQIAGISGGSGLTGPYTRTVTVTDSVSSAGIQGAKVRLYRTGQTGTEPANASGVATFTVEAATWSYAITANGYTGQSGTIVVSANGDTPISLVASVTTAPDDPALCAVTIPVINQFGVAWPLEPVTVTFTGYAVGATDKPLVVSPPPPQISDNDGFVLVNLVRFGTYRVDYGDRLYQRSLTVTVPDQGSYTVQES